MNLRHVPLADVLKYVTESAGLRYRVDPHAVVIYQAPPAGRRNLPHRMSSLRDQLGGELDKTRAEGLYRTLRNVTSAQGPRIRLDGREFLNFSSNDYLALANDPVLKQAGADAMEKYGVGAGASRLVSGNLQPYEDLERRLAAFKAKEAALVFSSGYAANVGTITALVGRTRCGHSRQAGSREHHRWRPTERRDDSRLSAQEPEKARRHSPTVRLVLDVR